MYGRRKQTENSRCLLGEARVVGDWLARRFPFSLYNLSYLLHVVSFAYILAVKKT